MPTSYSSLLWRLTVGAALFIVVLMHVVRLVALLGGPRDLLSDTPLLDGDYSLHAYYCLVRPPELRWSLWGYDPFFMAGYPKTAAFPTSSVYYELFTAMVGGASWRVLKLSVLVAGLLPLLLIPCATAFVAGRGAGAAAVVLVVAMFWVRQPEEFLRVGLASWLLGLALATGAIAAGAALLNTATKALWPFVAVLVLGLAAAYVHLLSLAAIALGILSVIVAQPRSLRTARVGLLAGAIVLVVAGTAPLWRTALSMRGWLEPTGVFYVSSTPWADLAETMLFGADPTWMLLVLAAVAPFAADAAQRSLHWRLLGAGGVLVVLGLLGSAVELIRALQPVRFRLAGEWLLIISAAGTLAALARQAHAPRPARWLLVLIAVLIVRLLVPGLVGLIRFPEPMVRDYAPEHRALIRWVREDTTPDARVLFEDISGLDSLHEQYPELYTSPAIRVLRRRISPLLPALTGRSFLGGLYYPAYLKHASVRFGNGRMFRKPLWSAGQLGLSEAELRRLKRLYNLGWAIVWSPPARRLLEAYPALCRPLDQVGPYTIFEFRGPHSFCLAGEAQVAIRWNEVELRQIVPDSNRELLLSFHWYEGLQPDRPEVTVERYRVELDPVPFVRLRFPTGSVPQRVVLRGVF